LIDFVDESRTRLPLTISSAKRTLLRKFDDYRDRCAATDDKSVRF